MEIYEALSIWNEKRLQGLEIGAEEQRSWTELFLQGVATPSKSTRYMNEQDRHLYPIFYIPPYNDGTKLRLLTGELPKTQLLSANHYELEILRLLALYERENDQVAAMLDKTARRLQSTCFAHFCDVGECPGASVSFLRFWSAYQPEDGQTIKDILMKMRAYHDEKGHWRKSFDIPKFYYWLALSELDSPQAVEEIAYSRDWLLSLLRRGWLVRESGADSYNIRLKYIVRNTLARLPGWERLREDRIFIGQDGRCYCEISELETAPQFAL